MAIGLSVVISPHKIRNFELRKEKRIMSVLRTCELSARRCTHKNSQRVVLTYSWYAKVLSQLEFYSMKDFTALLRENEGNKR